MRGRIHEPEAPFRETCATRIAVLNQNTGVSTNQQKIEHPVAYSEI
jgi:hypothetical protein